MSWKALIANCIDNNNLKNAKYYSEKLYSLKKGKDYETTFELATIYYLDGEYQRAIHLLTKSNLLSNSELGLKIKLKVYQLVAQCMEKNGQWEECIELLDSILEEDFMSLQRLMKSSGSANAGSEIHIVATLCSLKAKAHEAMENRQKSKVWYQNAVLCDVYCAEAYFELIDNQMLTMCEEEKLINRLDFSKIQDDADREMMKSAYLCRGCRYATDRDTDKAIQSLENVFGIGGDASVVR